MTRQKILLTRKLLPPIEERARRDYEADFNEDDHVLAPEELLRRAEGKAGLLICITEKFSADIIERLPQSVKILSTFSVGTDHIDLEAARRRGLRVATTPDAVTTSTAEIAMLLILGAMRRAPEGERLVLDRQWTGWEPMQLLGRQLDGKRLGIFGMGKIGRALAKRARAFGMDIHYHNRTRLAAAEEQSAIFHETLESLLANSDVLSVNVPSSPATKGVLDAGMLARLPRGAVLVNTSRGDLVDDDALVAALKSGQLAYAGFDVYKSEPRINEGYYGLSNVFLLPHMGTSTMEARTEMGFAALDNIDAVLAGREPPYPVV
jgi:lactate dehydrogenase-like 2-hydroxyacid dehydrogenase